jgi:hypothetical protein
MMTWDDMADEIYAEQVARDTYWAEADEAMWRGKDRAAWLAQFAEAAA